MAKISSVPASSDPYRSGTYAEANPDWHEADAEAKAEAIVPWLQRLPRAPDRVLDVGCGTGGVLAALKRRLDGRWPVTLWEGFDIAPEAIRRAAVRRVPRLRFTRGDVRTSAAIADVCLTVDVVEHVVDDEGFLAGIARRAPWHVLRIPLDLSVLDVARPRRLLGVRERYGHRHVYTREMALDRVRRAGLTVVGTAYHRVPALPETWAGRGFAPVRRALEALVPDTAARWLGGLSLVVFARSSS